MNDPRADRDNIRPAADITLTIFIISHSYHRAVGSQSYRMTDPCTDSISDSHSVPKLKAALFGIFVIARSAKCFCCGSIVSRSQQRLGLCIVGCLHSFRCVAVIARSAKCFCCGIIVSCLQQRLCLCIISRLYSFRCVAVIAQSAKCFCCGNIVPRCQQRLCLAVIPRREDHLR